MISNRLQKYKTKIFGENLKCSGYLQYIAYVKLFDTNYHFFCFFTMHVMCFENFATTVSILFYGAALTTALNLGNPKLYNEDEWFDED